MKYSNNYRFYPDNKALEHAITQSVSLLSDELAEVASPDRELTVADNFLHTRGNFEQHRYSTNILESARDALESTLSDDLREQEPLHWAKTLNSLGNIQAALAQTTNDSVLYGKALNSFNAALEIVTQADHPLEWAACLYNKGTALLSLGQLESDAATLKASIAAYTDVLLVWSRDKNTIDWALTMYQLGAAFHAYGLQLNGNRNLQKSVVSYKNALAGFDADESALELASTQNNRGAVLHNLGESEENSGRLEEAIRSYQTALTICLEQQLPIHLAVICRTNIATCRYQLAELTNDPAVAEEAAENFEVIIELFHQACQPLCFQHCEKGLLEAQALVQSLSGKK